MARKRSCTNTNRRRTVNRPVLLAHQQFSKPIRGELRMACALRDYSAIRMGKGKSLIQQCDFLNTFYHSDSSKSPSQIKILAKGITPYSDLYSSRTTNTITKKKLMSSNINRTRLYLKDSLSREPHRSFYAVNKITCIDLEKNYKQDLLLLMGTS